LGAQSQGLLKSQVDTRVELRALENQLGEVKAQLESTNVNLGDASQQIAALLQELRARAAAAAPTEAPQAAEDPKALYEAAYNEYLRGNYDVALVAFQNYIAVYPATDLSDNAVLARRVPLSAAQVPARDPGVRARGQAVSAQRQAGQRSAQERLRPCRSWASDSRASPSCARSCATSPLATKRAWPSSACAKSALTSARAAG
jgi:hypothetical protein